MPNATGPRPHRPAKPAKPRHDFPLYAHLCGKWAKVIRGKTRYFGSWDDPHGAETEYLAVAEDLHAGRQPRNGDGAPTVRNLCNAFMKAKRTAMDAGKLSPRTFADYDQVCRWLIEQLGPSRVIIDLRPADFERLYGKLVQRRRSLGSLGGWVTMIRSVFKYGFESDLIEKPVKYGPLFRAPSATDRRKEKAKKKHQNGSRAYTAAEIRLMLDGKTDKAEDGTETQIPGALPQLRAMILLGINCGFGNTDCASLPISALDLKNGWVDYPRPKTGADRRVPLWPATVAALREVLAARKEPADPEDAGLVFITRLRQRWVRFAVEEQRHYGKTQIVSKGDDAIAKEMTKLLERLGLKRPGLSFYSLRHTFETIAGGSRDQVAVDAIMGHIDSSMAANYRQHLDDERLVAVVNHVRQWLLGE